MSNDLHDPTSTNERAFDDLFTDEDPTRRVKGALAPVILVAGSKGGVGSTTTAITMAEMARTSGGIERVVLIDGDPTSGHVATYLRAKTSGPQSVPTILYGSLLGDYRRAVASPSQINAGHAAHVPDISFHTVLAPSASQYDQVQSGTEAYLKAVRTMRTAADLIIVDMGTVNINHPSPMMEAFGYPLLRQGAWMFVVSSTSQPAVLQGLALAKTLTSQAIASRERIFTLLNKRRGKVSDSLVSQILERFETYSMPLGAVGHDETGIGDQMEAGHIPSAHATLVPLLADALFTITGRPAFEEVASGKSKPGEGKKSAKSSSEKGRRLIPGLRR